MVAPISMEKITARGMSRCGFLLSPPSWTACSKPTRANTAPPSLTAVRTPWSPNGAKPGPGEVGGVEVGEEQDDDGQCGDDHLPGGDGVVGSHQVADPEQVGHHEEGHHDRGHQVARPGEDGTVPLTVWVRPCQ